MNRGIYLDNFPVASTISPTCFFSIWRDLYFIPLCFKKIDHLIKDFSSLSITVKDSEILYGSFIQNVVDFLIIAACVFSAIKIINKFKWPKHEEKKPEVKPEIPQDVKLLTEIRDLLKQKNK